MGRLLKMCVAGRSIRMITAAQDIKIEGSLQAARL
jgi:hypothetical protein